MHILLVADDRRIPVQVETALIGTEGLIISRVATPARALARLDDDEAFDLIVADADTAPEGGMSLAREVKHRHKMGVDTPPIVLLIARDEDRWLANWSQADAYVTKPVDHFDLLEVVEALVEGRPVPALPGVGADPTPSLLDRVPATRAEAPDSEGLPAEVESGAPQGG